MNCLSILISRLRVYRQLAVSKITAGKGETQAQAVIYALEEWGISEKVTAVSFDTTSTDTGGRHDTCV